ALAVACFLHVFVRHCRSVELANIAQLVNVIAPIFTSPTGVFLQTIYHPLRLYAQYLQSVALDPLVESPTPRLEPDDQPTSPIDRTWNIADLGPFNALDVIGTRDADRQTLTVGVINRDPDATIVTQIDVVGGVVAGSGSVYELNGPGPRATNSF